MSLPLSFQNAGVPANVEHLVKALGAVSSGGEGGMSFDGCELMRMNKGDGSWSYGQDGIEVEAGERMAINPTSLEHGFISWNSDSAAVVSENMVPIGQPAPLREDLKNTGHDWDEQLLVKAQTLDGDQPGTSIMYKSTAHGGKEAIRTLARQVVAQIQNDSVFIVPIVELGNTSYKHKKFGTIFKPVFKVVGWLDFDGNEKGAAKKVTKTKAKQTIEITEERGVELIEDDLLAIEKIDTNTPVDREVSEDPAPASARRRRRRT